MTSNPTVEAYGRLWAQHLASTRDVTTAISMKGAEALSTRQPSSSTVFTFDGPTPDVRPPQVTFFHGTATASAINPITANLDLAPPRLPAPRPWDYCLFGSALPRFRGRDIYKRAGVLAQSPSDNQEYIAVERELSRIQSGPRKRARSMSFFQHQIDSEESLLWNLPSLEAFVSKADGLQILEDARNSVFQYYVTLHEQDLPVPKLIEHHTWHGSIDMENMTIIPRKRRYNSDPILRYEEAQFENVRSTAASPNNESTSKECGRHIRGCRRAPRLSTVDECTEPSESPRREITTPSKSLIHRLSSAGHRTTISPWRFTFMSPSQATNDGDGTPSRVSATYGYGSPVSAKRLSPVRAAAMLRTPDCFSASPIAAARLQQQSSPVIFNKPALAIDHATPTHLASPDTRRSSTPTKKHRGRRRSSLTASRLLAISEIAHSPLSSPSCLTADEIAPVELTPMTVSHVDATTDHNSIIKDKSSCLGTDALAGFVDSEAPVETQMQVHANTSPAAEVVPLIETPDIPKESGLSDYETVNHIESNRSESEAAESDAVKDNLTATSPSTPKAESTVCPDVNFDMVDVDLRKNLDIFGRPRETSTHSPAISSPISPSLKTVDDDILGQSSTPADLQEVDGEVLDEDYDDDDDMTNAINHEQINDTIALNLPDMAVDVQHNAKDDIRVDEQPQRVLNADHRQKEADQNRAELQSFMERMRAGKGDTSIKVKRRSGSLGASATGSPIRRSEPEDGDESVSRRQPLGEKSPNMSPSPTKKRKTVEDEISSGLLHAPSLEDHSPPKPKRRRKNAETESDGILNPDFQPGEAQPPRRSTRTKRNLLPPAPSANGFALSKLPVIRSIAIDDGGFGGSPSSAIVRNDDRQLQATTRANTRRNKAGALHASDALNLQAKRKLSGADDDEGEDKAAATNKRAKTTKSGSAKSVRWGTPLASYQEPPAAVAPNVASESADELAADEDNGAIPAPVPVPATSLTAAPVTRRRTASRLPPPTPIKKPTGTAAGKVKKPSSLAAPRRTSAQLAAASAAKEEAARVSATMADAKREEEKKKKTSTRSRIGAPAAATGTTTRRRAARAA
ncbi:hypothetical protein MCOR29_003048 [Pyricularia oryzae]|uniref:Uncharacterized protein n=2 Tax=Pyricularia TaxID=48558 RepID=A0ABQ8NBJ5_PYRGI|nr:hypothetical protein MCOR01_003759 [Pyricularia oryzae]KAI6294327.1 hypothetical protein MCOR33_008530 [Pyricularia grisea]KAI6255003.1 hypothetical protein MCOR19_008489 [Pyricularia oryzae]KAI6268121.1 hypothetical protein MCOR26_009350 [Pyricularia oryzae]KAI6327272.1 hypothetical protein MCOR29_003048 [Pyricularia oryzae]